jgi:hypothetical protein
MSLEKKTKGAWVIHNAQKLTTVTNASDFEDIVAAGKCGQMMSSLFSTGQHVVDMQRVTTLAKAANINTRTELPGIIEALRKERLIDTDGTNIQTVGLTTEGILEHTSDIFDRYNPSPSQQAVIDLSELVTQIPRKSKELKEEIGDSFKLDSVELSDLFSGCESSSIVDYEPLDGNDRLYFNGNVFKTKDLSKASKVISSLSSEDGRKVQSVAETLQHKGAMTTEEVEAILGNTLYQKLMAIGFYDINEVSNAKEAVRYVTNPGAFNKFGCTYIEDAFDLAKAFVASLTYGMTKSAASRGKIQMIGRLLQKMIAGQWVGPATAIGQDYKILELKGVVEVSTADKGMCHMRLLKKEVGEIALKIIQHGDASENSLDLLPNATVTRFSGPEKNRMMERKKQTEPSRKLTSELLLNLRSGGIK